MLLQFPGSIAVSGRVERPGQLKDNVEVRLGAHAKFFSHGAERVQVSADEVAIYVEACSARTLQRDGYLDVPAMQAFLQNAPNAHLDGVELGRNSEVQVEKTMVDRLEAQGECQLITRLRLDLGIPGH